MVAAAIAVAGLAGCGFRLGFDEADQRCVVGEPCPNGVPCVDGICPPDGPDGGTGPDAQVGDGDGGIATVWRVDTATDFAGGATSLMAVAPRGALEPIAYYTGGLLERGSDSGVIASGASTTWTQVQAFPFTGKAAVARATEVAWGSAIPPGVGLTNGDNWTLTFEGEIRLDAGTWTFSLTCDDHGFLELADPATGAFQRIASSDWPNTTSGSFTAAAAGWYPIRWATSDSAGNASGIVRFAGPGDLNPWSIPRDRLRFRADTLDGLVLVGFDEERLTGELATTIDDVAPANIDWVNGRPDDVGLTSSDDFSTRWSGQLRIDVGGSYSFRYDTDDGQRLWIDGALLLDAWDEVVHNQISAPVALAPGWHEIVIDQSDHIVTAQALLTVESGPDLVGQPLPVDRLRPVDGRRERFESACNHAEVAIPDLSTASSSIGLAAPAGATVDGIDLMYQFAHTYPSDLVVSLIAPNGQTVVLRNHVDSAGSGSIDRFFLHDFDGAPVAGTWRLSFVDNVQQDSGTIMELQLTAHYVGGEPTAPSLASYESPVRDLGGVAAIDNVTWEARTAAGSGVAIRVRSCATATGCAAEPWSAPLTDPAGSTPAVAPQQFVQYRVELASSGDTTSSLEWIQLDFTPSP